MKNKGFLISLIFISVAMLVTVASAAQITQIGTGHDPAIYGNMVTWSDDAGSIHLYDLTAQQDNTISSFSSSHPAIYGNKMVWHDESSGAPRLTVYDIPSGSMSYITQNVDSTSFPAIYGNRIVWSANNNVYMRDISKHTQNRIASGVDPDIYDNIIVYSHEDGTLHVYMYDITTGRSRDISGDGVNQYPHIFGNKVIWSDFNTRLGNIRMYDIITHKQTDVTTGDDMTGYDTGGPTDLSNDKIVYLKHNLEESNPSIYKGDVYVYCIATGRSTLLSARETYTGETPVVSGNVIVWSDSGDIYMTRYRC